MAGGGGQTFLRSCQKVFSARFSFDRVGAKIKVKLVLRFASVRSFVFLQFRPIFSFLGKIFCPKILKPDLSDIFLASSVQKLRKKFKLLPF